MSAPKARKGQSTAKRDQASALQATLEREEARRKTLVKRGLAVLATGLVIAAAAVGLRGNAASASRTGAVADAPVPGASVVPAAVATEAPPVAEEPVLAAAPTPSPAAPQQTAPASVKPAPSSPKAAPPSEPAIQRIRIRIGVTGYSPSTVTASASSPILLTVDKGEGCAAGFLIPGLNVAQDNTAGPVTIDLGRVPAGSYQFTCGMEMIGGMLIVK